MRWPGFWSCPRRRAGIESNRNGRGGGMRRYLAFALVVLAVAPSGTAQAQNCKKGIRCGHTCIAATRTCHITSSPDQPSTPASSLAPSTNSRSPAAESYAASAATEPPASTHPYVALTRGSFYYRRSCDAAKELPKGQLVYFRSADEAENSGRLASRVRDCS